ncbi:MULTISPECIES: hypothetical protein [Pseudomonadota]|uniref:hypothetical protein n=1 Tax=Pseudomonadota TaxID=1224 RepID=UPI000C79828B|nr:hypothetical protein [Klebsiella pneumoniae]EKZ8390533.1 hypothetical protein [Salmonella enterica subsp. enterica serovar Agona]ELQ6010861.1 hypothetical protein [Cronobacter sakazakii]MCJ9707762.1 hypothetical protein [Bordetella hinzii]ELQ6052757.1 hypothetical protein [Cronobacter sakazakii]PLL22873.1 hypothetical protein CWN22_24545 [Klebsiella pneumoniae]
MADTNVTGRQSRELTKYRATFAAALVALAGAAWMLAEAYQAHGEFLKAGDDTGERLMQRGLIAGSAQHEQR